MNQDVLIIEDDDAIFGVIKDTLSELSLSCQRAGDGLTGIELARCGGYCLVILDLGLPTKEGTDVCKELREVDRTTPVLVVSAREDTLSKALLLELGADDYVTKPFEVLELKARVKAILRRAEVSAAIDRPVGTLVVGQLRIDFERYKAYVNDEEIALTPREYELLALLASQPGKPLSRSQLNEQIYGYPTKGYELSINSHINRIRAKIEPDPANPIYVLTVRGVGYCLAEPSGFSEDSQ